MKIQRREFLKTSLAVSATAALTSRVDAATSTASAAAGREYYDLRAYRLKPGASSASLDSYLETALFPALDKRGIKNVGAFTEIDVNKNAGTSTPKADSCACRIQPRSARQSAAAVRGPGRCNQHR